MPKGNRSDENCAKWCPEGAKGSQKGAKGSQKGAKGRQSEPKGRQRVTKMHPKIELGAGIDFRCRKGRPRIYFWETFWSIFTKKPEKTPSKKHPKIDVGKVRKNEEKRPENMVKLGGKSMEKRIDFRKVEFG